MVWGEALVSSEHVTGEALPTRVRAGARLPAGARNHDGALVLLAAAAAAESTPARIARLTATAQACATRASLLVCCLRPARASTPFVPARKSSILSLANTS